MGVLQLLLIHLLVTGLCFVDKSNAQRTNSTTVSSLACSGGVTMRGLTGTITSPRSAGSNKYPNNMTCVWKIYVQGGRRVSLKATQFDIEETDNCAYDSLHIFDGEDSTATVLGKFCGTNYPSDGINSTTNVMLLAFRSDNSIGKAGFRLPYTNIPLTTQSPGMSLGSGSGRRPTSSVCGGMLSLTTGRFGSPGFGTSKTYSNGAKCDWLIDAGAGKVVKLMFTDFDVEYSANCLYDHVSVYDGSNRTAPLIDAYCGSHLPPAFRSTGRHVTVVFRSDSSVQRAGFQASYSTEGKPADHPTVPGCYSASRPAVLSGTEGRIVSPEHGPKGNYPDKTICQWKIVVPKSKRVHLAFPKFSIEPDSACRYDHLQVYDGDDVTEPSLGRYCGDDSPGDITASGNIILVEFRSDDSVTAGGFSIVYSAKDALGFGNPNGEPPCGLPQFLPKFARIVGGTEAAPHTWPWQVSLQYYKHHMCGASIIAKRWIITAAHCLVSKDYVKDKEDLQVVLGEHNLHVVGGREQTLNISKIIVHPKYHKASSTNDIALLKLTTDIQYTSAILPVCLPRRDAPTDLVCVATGWGKTQGTADPKKLNQVRVPIISRAMCRRPDWYYNKFNRYMICAGFPEGAKDSCQGDSGGPLVCRDFGTYHLQGITSWGFGCARPKAPGVYTRVVQFIDWIEQHTNGTSQVPR